MLPAYKVAGGLSRGSAVFPAPGGRRIHGRGFGECVRRGRVRPARKAGGGRKDGGSRREERGREIRFGSRGSEKKKGGDSFWVSGGKALDMRRTPFGACKGGGTLSRRTEVSCEAPDQNTVITHVDFESKKPRAMPASSTRPLPRTHSRRPPPRAPLRAAPPPLSEKQITAESPPAPWGCSATLPPPPHGVPLAQSASQPRCPPDPASTRPNR